MVAITEEAEHEFSTRDREMFSGVESVMIRSFV